VPESPAPPPTTAFARLFARATRSGQAAAFSLPGGAPLFLAGEAAENLYLLVAGRLAAVRAAPGREPRFLGLIRPGELAGEMALLAASPHSADVIALRDCEVLALPRAHLLALARRDPALMIELSRLVVRRARQDEEMASPSEPTVFGLIAVDGSVEARALAEAIAEAIGAMGSSAAVAGIEARGETAEWFSALERAHEFVLYAVEAGQTAWSGQVRRQADRLVWLAAGAGTPPAPSADPLDPVTPLHRQADLVLVHDTDCPAPTGSGAWRVALASARHFHLRRSNSGDIRRLARTFTGRSVGLVLSGGAARAYAHVGVIRVLKARGVPIDFVGGASLGAIVAAGLAMGWEIDELEARIRRAFVDSSPLDDIAFPLIAMTRGEKVRARLARHFGDRDIADLWLPFFCVSSNLTTGFSRLHREGVLRRALTASVSLPGVLPPVIDGADVLVDGALMKNFPADLMRQVNAGPIIGVDVGRGRSIDAHDLAPRSVWRWILSGDWRKGPPIVSLLMRAATVSGGGDLIAARAATDVLIVPMVDDIEMRDWRAFEPAVAAGERAASAALDGLTGPVTELRRRPSTAANRPD